MLNIILSTLQVTLVGGRLFTTKVRVNTGGSASLHVETKVKFVSLSIDVNKLISRNNNYRINLNY